MLLEVTTISASTSSPKEAPVSISEPLPQAAAPLRPSIQDPQGTDKQQPEPSATNGAVVQTANPSLQTEAPGSVGTESDLQKQYFIEGTLLAVIGLAFTAIFGFIKLRRPRKRRVSVDAPAVEPMRKEPLHADPLSKLIGRSNFSEKRPNLRR